MRVLSIGEILWDIFPDQERLGGAALNFSANIARLGNSAMLITAVGEDERGRIAIQTMRQMGLSTNWVQQTGDCATGVAHVRRTATGDPDFEIPRPAAFDRLTWNPALENETLAQQPDWLYFGTLVQTEPAVEALIRHFAESLPGIRCFYDINLRNGHWNLPLVERLCHLASVLKMNETEAETLAQLCGIRSTEDPLTGFCEFWTRRFGIQTMCITLGEAGCYVYSGGIAYTLLGFPTRVEDTVGAGDAFAAAYLHGLHNGWPIQLTAQFANALGSIVAGKAGTVPPWSIEECFELARISSSPRRIS